MEERILRTVNAQLTSPNFAEFCITHVADPNYQFLYADEGSMSSSGDSGSVKAGVVQQQQHHRVSLERQLYMKWLEKKRRTGLKRNREQMEDGLNSCRAAWWSSVVPLLSFYKRIRQEWVYPIKENNHNNKENANKRIENDRTEKQQQQQLVSSSSLEGVGRRKGRRWFYWGPHPPLPFTNLTTFSQFLDRFFYLLEDTTDTTTPLSTLEEAHVTHMAKDIFHRAPMTEFFLHVLASLLWEILTTVIENEVETVASSSSSSSYSVLCLHSLPPSLVIYFSFRAVWVLFETVLLHRAHSTVCDGNGSRKQNCGYYHAVLEYYAVELSSLFYEISKRVLPKIPSSSSSAFLSQFQLRGVYPGDSFSLAEAQRLVSSVVDMIASWRIEEIFSSPRVKTTGGGGGETE